MAFLDKNRLPSALELKTFGLLAGLFAALVGALLRWRGHPGAALVVWALGGFSMLVYYGVPPLRRFMLQAWVSVTYPLGWLISHLVLALVYYGVFTPIGRIQRLLGRDSMHRRPDRDATTYWTERPPPPPPASYFKQS